MADPEPNLAGISASGHGTSIHLRDLCEFIVYQSLSLKWVLPIPWQLLFELKKPTYGVSYLKKKF